MGSRDRRIKILKPANLKAIGHPKANLLILKGKLAVTLLNCLAENHQIACIGPGPRGEGYSENVLRSQCLNPFVT